jgi:hypothetical protein
MKHISYLQRVKRWTVTRTGRGGGVRINIPGCITIEEAQAASDILDFLFSKFWKSSHRYFQDKALVDIWEKLSVSRQARVINCCVFYGISYEETGIRAPCNFILERKKEDRYQKRELNRVKIKGKIGYLVVRGSSFVPQVKREGFFFRLPSTRDEGEARNLADILIYIIKGTSKICNDPCRTVQEKFKDATPFFKFHLEKVATKATWEETKQAWKNLVEKEGSIILQEKREKVEKKYRYNYQFKHVKVSVEKPLSEEIELHFKGLKRGRNIKARLLKEIGKPFLISPRLSSMYWIRGEGYVVRTDWRTIVGERVLQKTQSINLRAEEIGVSCIGLFKVLRESMEFNVFFESSEYNQDFNRNNKKRPKIEGVLHEFLDFYGERVVVNHKPLLSSKTSRKLELDLYLPDRGIAFECNGNYWHSSATGKDRGYHRVKTELCLSKGIRLYHLWEASNEKILNIVKAKLGLLPKVGARKCKVVKVSHAESREFFNRNHTHGYAGEFVTYGLEHEGKLVSALAFRRLGEGVENARFVFDGCTVVGGFTKLLKAFLRDYEGQFKEIISFCDRDLTPDYRDAVYFKNGFDFLGDSGSSLEYYCNKVQKTEQGRVLEKTKYPRQIFQKHKLKEMFPDVWDESLTEAEILEKKQIYQIWNSGCWKFELKL